jgi:hypothetical protein
MRAPSNHDFGGHQSGRPTVDKEKTDSATCAIGQVLLLIIQNFKARLNELTAGNPTVFYSQISRTFNLVRQRIVALSPEKKRDRDTPASW